MGLCKCAKKKVTNLFCFEHRVNVCEYCLVENHNKCVVQSYLSWLADSDYDTNCLLCSVPLDQKETIRLKCLRKFLSLMLDLFHWECLDAWAQSLPGNTAPAGYKCQQCKEGIFPAPNQTSPTIENLRTMLQRANWARAGLGLSLLPELDNAPSPASFIPPMMMPSSTDHEDFSSEHAILHKKNVNNIRCSTPATVLNVGDDYVSHKEENQFTSRKSASLSDGQKETQHLLHLSNRDEDLPENKYKRRSASEWLGRWFKSQHGKASTFSLRARWRRSFLYITVCMIIIMAVFIVLSRIFSKPAIDDPAFNPLANPDIRIALSENVQ
ncbi:unnamed protein product [Thelazia callipaeda]|uniref:Zinc finger protein-like 1 homolog n=1 Tax=Thelazia callipaeda TaxID=103827 RepID=A0A0N5D4C7_THECL|nr:unnamed protein product [Thelazia callipaeda]